MKKIILALFCILASCTPLKITPIWSGDPMVNTSSTVYESLHQLLIQDGKLYGVGVETSLNVYSDKLVVFAQDQTGKIIWKNSVDLSSNDRPWKSIIANNGIVILTETMLVKFSFQGKLLWSKDFSLEENDPILRDVEISKNNFIVAGRSIYLIDFDGNLKLKKAIDHPVWDVVVFNEDIYTAGFGSVHKYSQDLNLDWSYLLPTNQTPPMELVVTLKEGLFVLSSNDYPQESTTMFKLNNMGKLVWKKNFEDPDEGYKLPGMPKIRKLNSGNLLVGLSQQPTRKLYIVNQDGKILKKMDSKTGLINELQVDPSGYIVVMGEGHPEVYSPNLELVARGDFPKSVDVTSGALAFDNQFIYVGAGVASNGTMKFYTACYPKKR